MFAVARQAQALPWTHELRQACRDLESRTASHKQVQGFPRFGLDIGIIGSGVGGTAAAQALANISKVDRVFVVNPTDEYRFPPLFTSGFLGVLKRISLRNIFKNKKIKLITDTAQTIYYDDKTHNGHVVLTEKGTVPFDYLVLATGSKPNKNMAPKGCLRYQTKDDIKKIRMELIMMINKVDERIKADNLSKQKSDEALSIALIGGGISSVELAFQLKETCDELIPGAYKKFKATRPNITVYSSGKTFLTNLHPRERLYIEKQMHKAGFKVKSNCEVLSANNGILETQINSNNDNEPNIINLSGQLPIFIGGTEANVPVGLFSKLPRVLDDKKKRLKVNQHLEVLPGVFAIGDAVAIKNQETQKHHRNSGQLAIKQAKTVSQVIQATIQGKPLPSTSNLRESFRCINLGKQNALISFLGLPKPFDCITITGKPAAWIRKQYYRLYTDKN